MGFANDSNNNNVLCKFMPQIIIMPLMIMLACLIRDLAFPFIGTNSLDRIQVASVTTANG